MILRSLHGNRGGVKNKINRLNTEDDCECLICPTAKTDILRKHVEHKSHSERGMYENYSKIYNSCLTQLEGFLDITALKCKLNFKSSKRGSTKHGSAESRKAMLASYMCGHHLKHCWWSHTMSDSSIGACLFFFFFEIKPALQANRPLREQTSIHIFI